MIPDDYRGVSIGFLGWELKLGHWFMRNETIQFASEAPQCLGSMHILRRPLTGPQRTICGLLRRVPAVSLPLAVFRLTVTHCETIIASI
jgi:hypothetical protein